MIPEKKWPRVLLIIVGTLMVINLLYLNYHVFLAKQTSIQKVSQEPQKTDMSETFASNDKVTLEEVEALIFEATQSFVSDTDIPEEEPNTIAPTPSATNSVAEYYIPLGTGSTSSTSWVELPGVEAYIAPSNYGTIVGIYFEASLRIPTGNGTAYARLKNVTDNVGLFESEVARNGESAGLVSSGKIPIPKATKLYRVEMKSSLGSTAVLDNARIKIFVQ